MFFLGTNYGEILSRYFNEGEEYLKSVNETNHLSGEYHQEVTGLFSLTADYCLKFTELWEVIICRAIRSSERLLYNDIK